MIKIRSKAPLRLGLAGGGTDIESYFRTCGGAVLNATIRKYAHCIVEPRSDDTVVFDAVDMHERFECKAVPRIDSDSGLRLHKGVYNRIVSEYRAGEPLPLTMTTYCDAPAGSGLGSSSTMVVAMIKAYAELLNLPIDDYEMAQLAYDVERNDLALSGGMQDQYAATFGGFNYVEFHSDGTVMVNPLRVKNWVLNELESSIVLYYTGVSRESAKIIDEQIALSEREDRHTIEGMAELKDAAYEMKSCLLRADFDGLAECVNRGWQAKKKTSHYVSSSHIEQLYDLVMMHGGKAAKISGAGGGGFMMIFCDPAKRYGLMEALNGYDGRGRAESVSFYERGAQAWTLY
ncbi:GHMP kinase [Raoultibacter timonensis]|uniref:GHMP family kinase ATP-binding protein n=1 Tax=Raoultibacter timonensis TaxID=1907662 RepID=UPI001CA538B1|nr:GHMP kinase [Raoultibacter timonensis]